MSYSVKEIYYTLQGEGANAGRPAVFCRFAGCNLWSGLEADRSSAICRFCDTDFVGNDGPGGGVFETPRLLAAALRDAWPRPRTANQSRFVVFTGGEPLLQLDALLLDAVHNAGFEIAIETNGTRPLPKLIDWVCVSPKAGTTLQVLRGQELKLVFPQTGAAPADYEDLQFDHFFLQPMDGATVGENTRAAIDYCLAHPRWRLSLQTHKYLGMR